MADMKIFTLDTQDKKSLELTHRGRKMEIEYSNGKQYGHDTVTGCITWRKDGYHEFQSFHVGRYGEERRLYIAFDVPMILSKTMKKELGKMLEEIIIQGGGK